jgi:hypothetical protein
MIRVEYRQFLKAVEQRLLGRRINQFKPPMQGAAC